MKSVLENNPSKTIEPSGFSTARGRNSLRAWKPGLYRKSQLGTAYCTANREGMLTAEAKRFLIAVHKTMTQNPGVLKREIYMYIERFNKPVKCYR